MKKARFRSEKLAVLLALALSVSCMTAAFPAKAAVEENNLLGGDGTFENLKVTDLKGWELSDYSYDQGDILEVVYDGPEHGNVLKKTEYGGSNSAAMAKGLSGWKPSTTYAVTMDVKGSGVNPIYFFEVYCFTAEGAPRQASIDTSAGPDWQTASFSFTTPADTTGISFRVHTYGGADGDSISIDNLVISPVDYVPSMEGWTADGYDDPDTAPYSDVELADEGYLDAGAVHFIHSNADDGTGVRKNAMISGEMDFAAGKTYVFTAYVKGNTKITGDSAQIELAFSAGQWTESGSSVLSLEAAYDDWTQITHEFTGLITHPQTVRIGCGGYVGADFYMDNIAVYDKDDPEQTNLFKNGNFKAPVTDAENNIYSDGDFESFGLSSVPGFTEIVNGSAEIAASYDGSTAVRIDGRTGNSYLRSAEFDVGEGDTVKIYGYYKADGGVPNAWINRIAADGTAAPTGLHPDSPQEGESFVPQDDGWVYFEKILDLRGYKRVSFLYGVDNGGAVLYDNVGAAIECNVGAGDANADGKVDICDLIRLKKYLADSENVCISSSVQLGEDDIGAAELTALRKCLMGVSAYGA